jgi:nitrite reductase/ring-hydroxylating ferredoxin subunit
MSFVPLGDAAGRTRWTVQDRDGHSYAVFVLDGRYVVTDAVCPHNGGPLVEGEVRNGTLICPWHWFKFDLATGQCANSRRIQLGCYPVREVDGELVAEIPDSPPRRSWAQILLAHAAGRR